MGGVFNFVDIILLVVVLLSFIFGITKGFLREIFSFIFFALAIILASLFYSDISNLFVKNEVKNDKIVIIHKNNKKTVKKKKELSKINKNSDKTPSNIVKRVFNKKKKGRTVADFIAFLIIFFFVLVIGSVVTYFIKKILVRGPMKSIDRTLGAFFGLLRGVLICSVVIYGAKKIDFKVKIINKSFFVKVLINDTIDLIKDFLPEGNPRGRG